MAAKGPVKIKVYREKESGEEEVWSDLEWDGHAFVDDTGDRFPLKSELGYAIGWEMMQQEGWTE